MKHYCRIILLALAVCATLGLFVSGAALAQSDPAKPIPISPADGETIATLTPTFVWSAFSGSDYQAGYQLRVRCEDCDPSGETTVYDTGFVEVGHQIDGYGDRHTYSVGAYSGTDPVAGVIRMSEPLECDKHYHWHVRYRDEAGNWSMWSGSPAPYHDFYVASIACSLTKQVWYVDQNMAQSGNGTEWSQAFKTIKEGIDAAVSDRNDIVKVADGTYTGDGNYNLDFGGKAITLKSENGPNNCIIQGVLATNFIGFYFRNGEGNNSVLEGFTIARFRDGAIRIYGSSPTIKNCIISETGYRDWDIAGVAIRNTGASTIITNCTFTNNLGSGAIDNTGGLTVTGSTFFKNGTRVGGFAIGNSGTLTVTNCSFSKNSGGDRMSSMGGAISNTGSLTVSHSTFSENESEIGVGAIITYGLGSSAKISNSTFLNNNALMGSYINSPGAIYSNNSLTTITNCIFAGNRSLHYSGAINGNNLTINNCTFVGNFARRGNGGAISATNSTITNCIFWANKSLDGSQIVGNPRVTYSDIEGGYLGNGSDNIDADPMFVDLGYWDDNGTPNDPSDDFFVSGDYHLKGNSPCIDAGTDAGVYDDMDGDHRPLFSGFDIGADEMQIDDLVIENQTLSTTQGFGACETITAGPAVNITPSGDVNFQAGDKVILKSGFSVEDGGRLSVVVDPSTCP